jgi:hypothetical protein
VSRPSASKPGAAAETGSGGRRRGVAGSRRAAKKQRAAADGVETAADGTVVGRDPRRLSPDELRALGHRGKPLLQAMRRRCVDCCGGKVDEVRRCTAVACPLWPYRMGTDPWAAPAAKPAAKPAVEPAAAAAERAPAVVEFPPAAAKPAPAVAVLAAAPAPREQRSTAGRRRKEAAVTEAPRLPFLDDAPA